MTATRHLLWRYGPEWQTVVRVIETIRAADTPPLEALATAAKAAARDAAGGAAWDAARGAARGAAWGAARGAAWGAAWDAAGDAARGAAWGAAGDAALAAAVFDLIGRHGYTREHHDLLTAPYRAAFDNPWENR